MQLNRACVHQLNRNPQMHLPIIADAGRHAFFFDFDGTLAEIAERPDAVHLEARAIDALTALTEASGGAVAVVTGREIQAIDHFLAPMLLPVAGVHGVEQRRPSGDIYSAKIDEQAARAVEAELAPLASAQPGLMLERKRGALALHYRARPDLEHDCLAWVERAISHVADVTLTRGKMVVEARFHRATKGTAIMDFRQEPPFAGRVPVFAGDDVTDEDAFAVVNTLGGLSIKVGPGETQAHYRTEGVQTFLDWLCDMAGSLKIRASA